MLIMVAYSMICYHLVQKVRTHCDISCWVWTISMVLLYLVEWFISVKHIAYKLCVWFLPTINSPVVCMRISRAICFLFCSSQVVNALFHSGVGGPLFWYFQLWLYHNTSILHVSKTGGVRHKICFLFCFVQNVKNERSCCCV